MKITISKTTEFEAVYLKVVQVYAIGKTQK